VTTWNTFGETDPKYFCHYDEEGVFNVVRDFNDDEEGFCGSDADSDDDD